MSKISKPFVIATPEAMEALAASLAKACVDSPLVIFLIGDLGAGKTTFARGFLQAIGYRGSVKSPTFTLLETYDLQPHKILHFDLYRLKNAAEFESIAGDDFFIGENTALIEWPEKAMDTLKSSDIHCVFTIKGDSREVMIEACNDRAQLILNNLLNT